MIKKYLTTFCLLIIQILAVYGQELSVKSFALSQADLTAQTNPRKDNNGVNCALVKVGIGLQGCQFEGGVMGSAENKTGEYWVYMPKGNRSLKIKHPNYAPVMVTFADFGIDKLENNKTYVLVMNASSNKDSNILSIAVNGQLIEMVHVEGGKFLMGITSKEEGEFGAGVSWSKPAHYVILSSYYIGKYEVTQALWQAIMGKNPSYIKGDNLPVVNVTWDDCQKFIKKLNSKTGKKFRLPTEAEWEYAARGGNMSGGYKYSGSNNVDEVAWYDNNSGRTLHDVGTKSSNELGIYDMSGNVWEWCNDKLGDYTPDLQTNPKGPSKGRNIVVRGGSFCSYDCFSVSTRRYFGWHNKIDYFGLRLVLSE